jgi:hypothetical protein
LDRNYSTYVSSIDGKIDMCYHAQMGSCLRGGLAYIFSRLTSNYDLPDLCLLSSCDYMCESLHPECVPSWYVKLFLFFKTSFGWKWKVRKGKITTTQNSL